MCALFVARRNEEHPEARKAFSKQLWRALRKERRQRYQDSLDHLIRSGSGISKLRSLQERQSGIQRITRIQGAEDEVHTDPDSIAEVFASFYQELYNEISVAPACTTDSEVACEEPVTVEEVAEVLKRLKNGKTGADDGLVAQILKTGHSGLLECWARFFSYILNGVCAPPSSWKTTKMKLIFKKGCPELPKNYRPISIVPVLSKVFSMLLYGRIAHLVERRMSEEQFGFRKGRGCADSIHVLRMVVEKSTEWGLPLWMAALDVEKAFDRVHHADLFRTLLAREVSARIVLTLRNFYAGLHARVQLWLGAESRDFPLQRGVRQGDPLSTLLFNLVIRDVLEEVEAVWSRRGYGTDVAREEGQKRLTHVAFADDVTLIARSWLSLQRMIMTLRDALQRRGLTLHPSKCQVQTNDPGWNRRGSIPVGHGFAVEVLPEGKGLVVLGTVLALRDATQQEVPNRIAAGWRAFWSMKTLLLKKEASLKQRIRLFDATVSSCVLWCCQSWAIRSEESRLLSSARRAMLRRMLGARRAPEEDYVEWIQRSTHKAERIAEQVGARIWEKAHWSSKWAWAGHVVRRPAEAWVYRTTCWRDSRWQALVAQSSLRPLRPARRRWTRWEDMVVQFCKKTGLGEWTELAHDRASWAAQTAAFALEATGGKGKDTVDTEEVSGSGWSARV